MGLRRFYTPLTQLRPGITITLPTEESLHATKTLRMQPGDQLEVFNGEEAYTAEIKKAIRIGTTVKLLDRIESVYNKYDHKQMHAYIAMIRPTRFQLLVEKLTELGVNSITPIKTEFSSFRPELYTKKMDKFGRIALAACKQAKRVETPEIRDVIMFEDLPAQFANHSPIVLDTGADTIAATELDLAGDNISFIIGPEGGFSDSESRLLAEYEWPRIRLGSLILRTETAAITTLAILQQLSGNFED